MLMVTRVFHGGVRRLPVNFLSTQPTLSWPEGERCPDPAANIKRVLFISCAGCLRASEGAMCSIPQGVFAAYQVRVNVDRCTATRPDTDRNVSSKDIFDNKALEQPPLKYNSKLMNSIWGLYNRYSVHNFKKNTDDAILNNFGGQQCQAPADTAAKVEPSEVSSPKGASGGTVVVGASNNAPSSTLGGALGSYRSLALMGLRAL